MNIIILIVVSSIGAFVGVLRRTENKHVISFLHFISAFFTAMFASIMIILLLQIGVLSMFPDVNYDIINLLKIPFTGLLSLVFNDIINFFSLKNLQKEDENDEENDEIERKIREL